MRLLSVLPLLPIVLILLFLFGEAGAETPTALQSSV